MDANEYQRLASRTFNTDQTMDEMLTNGALGLAGESGEVADVIKKYLFHGHALDTAKVQKELGDLLWYVAQVSWALDFNLSDAMQANIDKLWERYPNGFNHQDSINRKES
jgi:NTP pyrophosphatase (non-canonical NTP hydrolase)